VLALARGNETRTKNSTVVTTNNIWATSRLRQVSSRVSGSRSPTRPRSGHTWRSTMSRPTILQLLKPRSSGASAPTIAEHWCDRRGNRVPRDVHPNLQD